MRNRVLYLDILKGFSVSFVVMLHVAAVGLTRESVGSFFWNVCNVADSMCRFVVPIFLMVSGALMLRPEKEYNLKKSLRRLAIPLLLWSALYSALVTIIQTKSVSVESVSSFFKLTFLVPTHNWFLYMLLGVYLMIPLLRPIVRNSTWTMNFFLVVWAIFSVCVPFLKHLDSIKVMGDFLDRFCLNSVFGYSGFYVLGYRLSILRINYRYRWKAVIGLLIFSVLLVAVISLVTLYLSCMSGSINQVLYDYMSPPVVLYSVCLFLLARLLFDKTVIASSDSIIGLERYPRFISIVTMMSTNSLAIYMLHIFLLIPLMKVGVDYSFGNPIFTIPLVSILVYILSFIFVLLGTKIPFIRKYMI